MTLFPSRYMPEELVLEMERRSCMWVAGLLLGMHKNVCKLLEWSNGNQRKYQDTLLKELLNSDIKLVMSRIFVRVTKIS